jgi:hypothetical protein
MTVLGYVNDYGVIFGGYRIPVAFLPKLQNGYVLNVATQIGQDISALGQVPNNYGISWNVTFSTSALTANAPSFQSPIRSSQVGVAVFVGSGTARELSYINFLLQTSRRYAFLYSTAGLPYPTVPTFVSGGNAEFCAFPQGADLPNADTVLYYPQFSAPENVTLLVEWTSRYFGDQPDEILSNNPVSEFVVVESPS